jgi:hypothetical protein
MSDDTPKKPALDAKALLKGFVLHQYLKQNSMPQEARIELQSVITCPECGHKKEETMPVDACRYFYECENCHARLKPKAGDCCVFCSYGTVKCPPVQASGHCC